MNSYYEFPRTELLPFIPDDLKTALDVGCAAGVFGKMLKEKYGCFVWGIEPVTEMAQKASDRLDKVTTGYFDEKIDFGDQKFGAIFFNDVLEHMESPEKALQIAQTLLSPGGKIIASIPNILHFETLRMIVKNKDWKYENAGILDRTHLRFFTRKSIIRMFEESGFIINKIEGINPEYKTLFRILRKVLPSYEEMSYVQFAVVAQKA